jgi:Trp operon repressor
MEHLSSVMEQQQNQQQVQWRRDKVQELCSKGYCQTEISQILQFGLATVNRDISYMRIKLNPTSKDTLTKDCQKSMRNVL